MLMTSSLLMFDLPKSSSIISAQELMVMKKQSRLVRISRGLSFEVEISVYCYRRQEQILCIRAFAP